MKKGLFLLILVLSVFPVYVLAQEYPPEWNKYTYGGYLYDIESDCNYQNISEIKFTNNLLNTARTNLAKQIEVRIQENATIGKYAKNGTTTILYTSESIFSTDINIKLLETKTKYDSLTKQGFAIAYIDKEAACQYYKNEINGFFSKISNSLTIAHNYVETGFKNRAKDELENVLFKFEITDEPLFWLNIFGLPEKEIEQLLTHRNELEQSVKQNIADLQYGTSIYLVCLADIFGTPDKSLQNNLKGELAKEGCNFTDDPKQADYSICVNVSSREYNCLTVYSQLYYFSYVDADIIINKVITSQRIYENRISVKGGHIFNYKEAARAAFKDLNEQLGSEIIKIIKQ